MSNNTWVLYHAGCDDGFTAAWAAWCALGDDVTYWYVSHQKPPPEIPDGSKVFMLDFCYPREILLDFQERMESVQVLDHHSSAQKDAQGLDFCHFDMSKSGAHIAWRHFHPGTEVPWLVLYVEDYDLWKKELPGIEEFKEYLQTIPRDFEAWSNLAKLSVEDVLQSGREMVTYRDALVRRAVKKAFQVEIGGALVPVVNSSMMVSEIANVLLKEYPEAPFSAVYSLLGDGQQEHWSVRSRGGDFDVSKVAKMFGGGGHKGSAGFHVPRGSMFQSSEPGSVRKTRMVLLVFLLFAYLSVCSILIFCM